MEKQERKVYQAMESMCEAVCLINKVENNFKFLNGTEYWRGILGEEGSLHKLFECLFAKNLSNEEEMSAQYQVFVDESFFWKERSQGMLIIPNQDGDKAARYDLVQISEEEAGFTIFPFDDVVSSQKVEQEKIDTIQNNYLFSMIVDIRTDACINSNTTEVGASSQSFRELKYSDWRNMISNMFLPEDKNMFLVASSPEHVLRTLKQNKSFKLELQMLNLAGAYIWVRLNFSRMKGFSEENPRFVYTVQDIDDEMKQLLNQENIIKAVEEQNKQLQRADQAKSAFISNMSHEIRTPINAVLGMNEMIIREAQDEKIRAYAQDIKSASKLLLSIINDILDFSKIEAGKMEIIPVEYRPEDAIRNACNLIVSKLKEKRIDFELQIDPDIPCKLLGDEVRITQVVTNILTNAAKYTEKGKVTFSIETTKVDERQVELRFTVQDTGIGMREEDMEKLFSAYTRLDEKRNRNIEGTGLGMSIVTRLLEQMGSSLEVESEYGAGSKFSFVIMQEIIDKTPLGEFNLAKSYSTELQEGGKEELLISKARILAVDDSQTNLRVLQALLKRTKAEVTLAKSGEQALNVLKKREIDLILLDHFMPDMDGVETLARIRQLGAPFDRMPIIALTANVVSGAKEFYVDLGFDSFLEKPINVEQLENTLREHLPEKCFD